MPNEPQPVKGWAWHSDYKDALEFGDYHPQEPGAYAAHLIPDTELQAVLDVMREAAWRLIHEAEHTAELRAESGYSFIGLKAAAENMRTKLRQTIERLEGQDSPEE